jgi:hypothetical protein
MALEQGMSAQKQSTQRHLAHLTLLEGAHGAEEEGNLQRHERVRRRGASMAAEGQAPGQADWAARAAAAWR